MDNPRADLRNKLRAARSKAAQRRKANAAIAETAIRIVLEHHQGRAAEACMADLDRAAREMKP